MNDKLLFLAKNYDLVEGDTFELFYRGVIRSMNPYKYYIYVDANTGEEVDILRVCDTTYGGLVV